MKVKFKTRSSGTEGTIYPGQVVDVPESEARMLAEGGYAVLLEQPRTAEAEQTAEETEQMPEETEQPAEKAEQTPEETEQPAEKAEQTPEETEQPAEKAEQKAEEPRRKPERKRG